MSYQVINRLALLCVIFGSFFKCYGTETVYKYRIYCNTEAANVYSWAESEPTTCPNNTSHSINTSSISVVDERGSNTVKIKEEEVATGGYICIENKVINIATGPDVDTVTVHSWPYPVSVLGLFFLTYDNNEGDVVRLEVPYRKIYGALTQDVSEGDTVINVSSTVMDNISLGFYVILDNGTTTNYLGRVFAIDRDNSQITVETAATDAFLAATPTYVRVSVKKINDYEIGPAGRYTIGASVGASYVPANEVVYLTYTNKTAETKKILVNYEYLH